MIEVFGFLLARSMRNRFARRLARLREPRYLIPTLVSVGWVVFWASRAFVGDGNVRIRTMPWAEDPQGLREGTILFGSLVFFIYVAILWIVPSKGAVLDFTPAEVHFLFTAPVSRRQIVHYKLIRAQIGILFGATIAAFFWSGKLLSLGGLARVVGFWLMFANLHLHTIGAGFVRTGLIEQGVTGLKRRIVPILVVLLFVVGLIVGTLQAWPAIGEAANGLIGDDGDFSQKGLSNFLAVVSRVGTTGILGVVLWPFQALARLVFALTPGEFLRWFVVVLGILGLQYIWVINSDAAFEEASAERAQKLAARRHRVRETARRGGRLVTSARPFPWKLAPTGRPEVAILWKNLVSMSRVVPVRAMFALGTFLLAILGWTIGFAKAGTAIGVVMALLLAQIAAFTSFFGPLFVRNDLREDLFRIDQVKTLPIAGHAVVWGEILGPFAVLAGIQLLALGVAVGALLLSGIQNLGPLSTTWMVAIAVGAMFVLPALTLASVALQNALVLMFPAWVSLGNSRARGFEASGQRILSLFGTLIVNAFITLPAVICGAVLTYVLLGFLGPTALVLGSIVAAAWIVGEVWFGCRILGKIFDRIDPSTAGIEAQEE
ncbi:MAG: putative ABC exporter domain-containing protein [Candidatus Eiseniibacteriota bacterium]